jgi:putative NIF3 family GTP cyclohydrolase 1 type 2
MKALITVSLILLNVSLMSQNSVSPSDCSAGTIIAQIISYTGAATITNTVDVIKEGDSGTTVTGIVTCMFATMKVLREAVDKNCNLIIVHEPLYYNHFDETSQFLNDPVFLEKKKFINDHNLVIFRFHDYIHSIVPDGIESGMIRKLGWTDYKVKNNLEKFIIPETSLNDLLVYLKKIFPANSFYVVGKPDMKLSHVSFAAGAPGSQAHISMLEDNFTDVVIAGEAQQWETYEYVRDAVDQGKNKAIIFLGHINSEEAGMDFCADWLRGFIKDIPVSFVECGSSYWSF